VNLPNAKRKEEGVFSCTESEHTNLLFAKSYIFSRTTAGNKKSPIDILTSLKESFLVTSLENRFVVIATYGHGKTHFALALANYFGKSIDTEECEKVLQNLSKEHLRGHFESG